MITPFVLVEFGFYYLHQNIMEICIEANSEQTTIDNLCYIIDIYSILEYYKVSTNSGTELLYYYGYHIIYKDLIYNIDDNQNVEVDYNKLPIASQNKTVSCWTDKFSKKSIVWKRTVLSNLTIGRGGITSGMIIMMIIIGLSVYACSEMDSC